MTPITATVVLLAAAFVVVVVGGVWPAIRNTAKYEIQMWRIKREKKRTGVKFPVPDVTKKNRQH